MEKESPGGRLRVDAVGDALEMHLLVFQFIDQVHQCFYAAPEPVQFPDHEGIGLAQLGQRVFQPWAFDLRTAEFVGENALAACFLERLQLHFKILLIGRHSGVSDSEGLKFSLWHQILDTRTKDEETRRTNQEVFENVKATFLARLTPM
jgi:hypothetical protein